MGRGATVPGWEVWLPPGERKSVLCPSSDWTPSLWFNAAAPPVQNLRTCVSLSSQAPFCSAQAGFSGHGV